MSENKLVRAVVALPFLAFSGWVAFLLHRNGINECINGFIEEIVPTKMIDFGSVKIPILQKFFHVESLDDGLRPVTVAFAGSTLAIDPVSWYQAFTFLTDYGLLYAIWLFESTRKANNGTIFKYPFFLLLPAQMVTIGLLCPIYYFLYYIFTPLSKLQSPASRATNPAYTRGILFTLGIFFYIPLFGTYAHPSLTARHWWNWAWQLFPVYISITQSLIALLPSSSSSTNKANANTSDLPIIRYTIGTFAIISASVWIYVITTSPFPLTTLFVPYSPTSDTFLPVMRRFFQVDQVSSLEASLLWLTYLFWDLKKEGLVKQSWAVLFAVEALLFVCFGPGFTLAAGWLYREEILVGAQGARPKKTR